MTFAKIKIIYKIGDDINYNWLFKQLKTNCSEFMTEMQGKPLFRGVKFQNSRGDDLVGPLAQAAFFESSSPKDRKPLASSPKLNDALNAALEPYGFSRQNSTFATADYDTAIGYTSGREGSDKEVLAIFPINGFEYLWNTRYADLYYLKNDPTIAGPSTDLKDKIKQGFRDGKFTIAKLKDQIQKRTTQIMHDDPWMKDNPGQLKRMATMAALRQLGVYDYEDLTEPNPHKAKKHLMQYMKHNEGLRELGSHEVHLRGNYYGMPMNMYRTLLDKGFV